MDDIKAYWGAWAVKQTKGDPFSFLGHRERVEQEEQGQEEEEQEGEGEKGRDGDEEDTHPMINKSHPPPVPELDIDSGIPLPCECDTPAMCTTCLQQLAPKWGSFRKTFYDLVVQVDALEVSPVWIT